MTSIKRRKELIEELSKYKLELRDDSKLCQNYIENTLNKYYWTLKRVVNRMCEMHYLYNYADMEKCLDEAREDHISQLEAGFIPDTDIFYEAERLALKNRSYPTKWPWME